MNGTLTTADGLKLHVQHWPVSGSARGTVLIVHGLGEHIGRYAHVARHLNEWGWNAVGYDHRGHGRSDGGRGKLGRSDDLLRDLALVIDVARREHPGPLVLLGHSMGGVVAARFVAEDLNLGGAAPWYRRVDALALSSPALAADVNRLMKLMVKLLASLLPNLTLRNGLKPEWISRDPQVVSAYGADPLVHDRISLRLVRFILDDGELVRARAGGWTLPTLLVFAGSDLCAPPRGSREFAADAPASAVTVREFAPLFHEVLNEPEQAEVFATLGAWLARRIGHEPLR